MPVRPATPVVAAMPPGLVIMRNPAFVAFSALSAWTLVQRQGQHDEH